jgi:hypothetical protein
MAFVVVRVSEILALLRLRMWWWLRRRGYLLLRWNSRHAAFNNFVNFSTVKPHATALGTIIDLDALAIGHHQNRFWALRAFHE